MQVQEKIIILQSIGIIVIKVRSPCFRTFYNYHPYLLQNYAYTYFFAFIKDHRNYFFVHAQLLINGKPVSQYAHFQPIPQHYKQITA